MRKTLTSALRMPVLSHALACSSVQDCPRAGFQVRWGVRGAMHSVRLVEAFRANVD
jgi:hypothetical protein